MRLPANDNALVLDARLMLEVFDVLELARTHGYFRGELAAAVHSIVPSAPLERIGQAIARTKATGFVVELPNGRLMLERRVTAAQLGFVRELISVLARSA